MKATLNYEFELPEETEEFETVIRGRKALGAVDAVREYMRKTEKYGTPEQAPDAVWEVFDAIRAILFDDGV